MCSLRPVCSHTAFPLCPYYIALHTLREKDSDENPHELRNAFGLVDHYLPSVHNAASHVARTVTCTHLDMKYTLPRGTYMSV